MDSDVASIVEDTELLHAPPATGRRKRVSVVLPAYNEAGILRQSLDELYDYLSQDIGPRYDWELVVVDDGSTDATGAIADDFALSHRGVRVLHHRTNFNLGQALRYAFGTCTGDYVITIDSDLSYSPDHVGRLLDAIDTTNARIVIASPYAEGGEIRNVPFFRRVVSQAANRFLSFTVRGQLSTLTSMVRAYDRPFLASLNLKAMDVEVNSEIIYKARILRARIIEIPAVLDWGKPDPSRLRKSSLRVGRSTAAYVFSGFLFRPVMLFVLPGVLLVLTGFFGFVLTGALVAVHRGGWVDHPVLLAGSGIAAVLGVQLAALGILALQAKRYFEELFHLGTSVLRRANEVLNRVPGGSA